MLNKQLENMAEAEGCPNKSKVTSKRKALRKLNITIIERNIKKAQQKPVKAISFLFCFYIRAIIKSEKSKYIKSCTSDEEM